MRNPLVESLAGYNQHGKPTLWSSAKSNKADQSSVPLTHRAGGLLSFFFSHLVFGPSLASRLQRCKDWPSLQNCWILVGCGDKGWGGVEFRVCSKGGQSRPSCCGGAAFSISFLLCFAAGNFKFSSQLRTLAFQGVLSLAHLSFHIAFCCFSLLDGC